VGLPVEEFVMAIGMPRGRTSRAPERLVRPPFSRPRSLPGSDGHHITRQISWPARPCGRRAGSKTSWRIRAGTTIGGGLERQRHKKRSWEVGPRGPAAAERAAKGAGES